MQACTTSTMENAIGARMPGLLRVVLAAFLLCALPLVDNATAGDFDWRMRGVLFRVTAPEPTPPATAGPAAAEGVEASAGDGHAAAATSLHADNAGEGDEPDTAGKPGVPALGEPAAAQAPADPAPAVQATLPSDPIPMAAAVVIHPPGTSAAKPELAQAAEGLAPSFVFATIHYGDMDALLLHLPRLRQQLEDSKVLVNEVDLSAAWQPEYESYRQLPQGQSLRRLIGEDAFKELQAQLPDADLAALDSMKPWVAMSVLEFPPGHEDKSIDAHLQEWAQAAGLERVHLENLPDQLAALDCVQPGDYAPVLRQRLLGGWSFDLDAERTVGYYRQRDLAAWLADIEAMRGLTGAAVAAEEEARRCLISVRNARWLPVLRERLEQGGAFVAVGAIHLTGAEGLLMQLREQGFQVSVEPW